LLLNPKQKRSNCKRLMKFLQFHISIKVLLLYQNGVYVTIYP
jgi:hypothetical protein